jgi:mitochondrial import inner membrane translocase subunit TIM44
MQALARVAPSARFGLSKSTFASSSNVTSISFGRTAAFRRLSSQSYSTSRRGISIAEIAVPSLRPLRSHLLPTSIQFGYTSIASSRAFHQTSKIFQQQQQRKNEDIKEEDADGTKSSSDSAKASSESSENAEAGKSESKEEGEAGKGEKGDKDGKEKKKEDAPPPPPHGDKTPWQVFTETLQTEFKASKEWNESTKALASSAHQFTENPNVKRAKSAYTTATDTASSAASQTLRKTGSVIGKTAAWTWDTPVVKGVRSGVNATGRVVEKSTRPVRETQTYKKVVGGVKDVIDDGSSSKYGGWVEKEERRKAREAREARETTVDGLPKKTEKMEEDPKYAHSK